MGGTMIVDPDGKIAAELPGEEDGVLVHACDLDATRFGKDTISISSGTAALSIMA